MQIVSIGDNLHEMSNPVFWGEKKKIQFVLCLIFTQSTKHSHLALWV